MKAPVDGVATGAAAIINEMAKQHKTRQFQTGPYFNTVSVEVIKDKDPLILRYTTVRQEKLGQPGVELPKWCHEQTVKAGSIGNIATDAMIDKEFDEVQKEVEQAFVKEQKELAKAKSKKAGKDGKK
jgi:hypothetical protein